MITMAITIVLLALVAGYNRYRIHRLDRIIDLMTDNSLLQTVLIDKLMLDWCERHDHPPPPGHDKVMGRIKRLAGVS